MNRMMTSLTTALKTMTIAMTASKTKKTLRKMTTNSPSARRRASRESPPVQPRYGMEKEENNKNTDEKSGTRSRMYTATVSFTCITEILVSCRETNPLPAFVMNRMFSEDFRSLLLFVYFRITAVVCY